MSSNRPSGPGLAGLLLALAPLLLVRATTAHPPGSPPRRFAPEPYELVLEDAAGRRLRTFSHAGQRFVLGRQGQRYRVRLINHASRRVEAVLSVDGRDAIRGRAGDYVHHRGYIIAPHDSIIVDGFRQSLERVATFRSTDPADSYAARLGSPENVGVIGAAFFPERRRTPPWRWSERRTPGADRGDSGRDRHRDPEARRDRSGSESRGKARRSRSRSAEPSRDRARRPRPFPRHRRHNLGTRYGESRRSSVREVPFRRARPRRPDAIVVLHYDDADGLHARGIDLRPEHPVIAPHPCPEPFPDSRFATPPPARCP